MIVAVVDWTNVLLALIAAIPGIIGAVYAGRVHAQIRTPSGKRIGAQVEDTLHTAYANNKQLMRGRTDEPPTPPPAA